MMIPPAGGGLPLLQRTYHKPATNLQTGFQPGCRICYAVVDSPCNFFEEAGATVPLLSPFTEIQTLTAKNDESLGKLREGEIALGSLDSEEDNSKAGNNLKEISRGKNPRN